MHLLVLSAADPLDGSAGGLQTIMEWANVSSAWELWLVVFGFAAQALFVCRWVVQWLATERRGESHVPEVFWWISLMGATLLFVYYLLRGEPVGLLGQCIGWTIYSRNLHLIYRKKRAGAAGPDPSAHDLEEP